jgi:catalase
MRPARAAGPTIADRNISFDNDHHDKELTMTTTTTLGVALALGITTSAVASPDPSTPPAHASPAQLVDALHTAFGQHHARAVHAKGLILEGSFVPDPHAGALTKAVHVQKTASKVLIRFSDFTGLPDIPDNSGSANPRGIAIRFTLPDGTSTDIVGHSFDGFPTENPDQFRELLLAIASSGPTAAKPTPLDRFLGSHPVAKTFLTTQKTPASYATITYFGVNAFQFTNAAGKSRFVRYQFVPVSGEKLLTADEVAQKGATYLAEEIRARVAAHVFAFDMYAQLAEPGDKVEDPSIAWPSTRRRVALGRLTVERLASNTPEQDRALAFSPTNLVDGITPADPMITFRGHSYPISVKERQDDPKAGGTTTATARP